MPARRSRSCVAAGAGAHAFLYPSSAPAWLREARPEGAYTARQWNRAQPASYIEALRAGGNALAGHEWLDLDTSLSDLMMMGLRRHDGVDLELAGKRLGLDVEKYLEPALHRLRSDGLLERQGNWVKASPRGWRLLNRLTAEFAASLLGPPRG